MGDKKDHDTSGNPHIKRKRRSPKSRRRRLERRLISYALTAGATTVAAGHEIK